MKDNFFNNQECDASKGEVYLGGSSGKKAGLAACKKSCEDEAKCKSITFFKHAKHCSHFSTECLVTKEVAHKNVISMRLNGTATTALTLNPHP